LITVACVLRAGGVYDASWVAKLRDGAARHLDEPHRFVCLSDVDVPCERIELVTTWPRWWAKIELFRRGLFDGPVLYLDLDSVVVGPLGDLFQREPGFRSVKMWGKRAGGICSTAMTWCGDYSHLFSVMASDADWIMQHYDRTRPGGRIGDQAFIEDALTDAGEEIRHWPGLKVASFKDHSRHAPPVGASVVAFHGRPKPNEYPSPWVRNAWR
jgi:hypothetical protein